MPDNYSIIIKGLLWYSCGLGVIELILYFAFKHYGKKVEQNEKKLFKMIKEGIGKIE